MKRLLFWCLLVAGAQLTAAQPRASPLPGLVVTPTGVPVAGASVWQRDRPGNAAVTNADGIFLLPVPPESSFVLRVEAAGFRRQDRLVSDTTRRPVRVVLFPTARPALAR